MAGMSKQLKGWYADKSSEDCHFCNSIENLMPLYHPKPECLVPGKGGSRFTVCRPCYIYYRACGLGCVSWDLVEEKLKGRVRRNRDVDIPAADLDDPMLARHSDGTPVTMDEVFGPAVNLDIKLSDL